MQKRGLFLLKPITSYDTMCASFPKIVLAQGKRLRFNYGRMSNTTQNEPRKTAPQARPMWRPPTGWFKSHCKARFDAEMEAAITEESERRAQYGLPTLGR
jgi:hypothetical protein